MKDAVSSAGACVVSVCLYVGNVLQIGYSQRATSQIANYLLVEVSEVDKILENIGKTGSRQVMFDDTALMILQRTGRGYL